MYANLSIVADEWMLPMMYDPVKVRVHPFAFRPYGQQQHHAMAGLGRMQGCTPAPVFSHHAPHPAPLPTARFESLPRIGTQVRDFNDGLRLALPFGDYDLRCRINKLTWRYGDWIGEQRNRTQALRGVSPPPPPAPPPRPGVVYSPPPPPPPPPPANNTNFRKVGRAVSSAWTDRPGIRNGSTACLCRRRLLIYPAENKQHKLPKLNRGLAPVLVLALVL